MARRESIDKDDDGDEDARKLERGLKASRVAHVQEQVHMEELWGGVSSFADS